MEKEAKGAPTHLLPACPECSLDDTQGVSPHLLPAGAGPCLSPLWDAVFPYLKVESMRPRFFAAGALM